jgi:hypothetical protein
LLINSAITGGKAKIVKFGIRRENTGVENEELFLLEACLMAEGRNDVLEKRFPFLPLPWKPPSLKLCRRPANQAVHATAARPPATAPLPFSAFSSLTRLFFFLSFLFFFLNKTTNSNHRQMLLNIFHSPGDSDVCVEIDWSLNQLPHLKPSSRGLSQASQDALMT